MAGPRIRNRRGALVWILLATTGLVLLGVGVGIWMGQGRDTCPPCQRPETRVVVVGAGAGTGGGTGGQGPELPTYPRRDPEYPLRGQPNPPQQLGVLVGPDPTGAGDPKILPLLGAPLPQNRDRWNYWAATDQNHMLRVPISAQGRDCGDPYNGCREIYDGDQGIQVAAYPGRAFAAQMYRYRTVFSNQG